MRALKALTVQQPWVWAIVVGAKGVENRTARWSLRGPLLIHAGKRLSERGCELVPGLLDATHPDLLPTYASTELTYGAIVGAVDVVDAHRASECAEQNGPDLCSPWAEHEYVEHGPRGAKIRRDVVHYVLAGAVAFDTPVPCKGALSLWTPDPMLHDAIAAQVPA